MRRGVLCALVLLLAGGWFLLPASMTGTERRSPRVPRIEASASRGANAEGSPGRAPRAGFPRMTPTAVSSRQTWSVQVEQELGASAALAAGDAWTPEARRKLLSALRRLRDTARMRDATADTPESDEALAAARRHREAVFAANGLSLELFGEPLGAFVQRAQPGVIEEVPLG